MSEQVEDASGRFTRLAEARVNVVLNGYRLLSNLIGANYKSSMDQRTTIIKALRQGLDELEDHFGGAKADKAKFKFNTFTPDDEV